VTSEPGSKDLGRPCGARAVALRNFIRRRVQDAAEAEDILQEVLYELVAAHRLMQPIEQAGAWLLRVARNRIIRPLSARSGRKPFGTRSFRAVGR